MTYKTFIFIILYFIYSYDNLDYIKIEDNRINVDKSISTLVISTKNIKRDSDYINYVINEQDFKKTIFFLKKSKTSNCSINGLKITTSVNGKRNKFYLNISESIIFMNYLKSIDKNTKSDFNIQISNTIKLLNI